MRSGRGNARSAGCGGGGWNRTTSKASSRGVEHRRPAPASSKNRPTIVLDVRAGRRRLTYVLDVVRVQSQYRTASWHPSEGRSRSGAGLTSVGSIPRFENKETSSRDVE